MPRDYIASRAPAAQLMPIALSGPSRRCAKGQCDGIICAMIEGLRTFTTRGRER
jgi:hypothetical protein